MFTDPGGCGMYTGSVDCIRPVWCCRAVKGDYLQVSCCYLHGAMAVLNTAGGLPPSLLRSDALDATLASCNISGKPGASHHGMSMTVPQAYNGCATPVQ
jgi:hypothetical protein